MNRKRKIKSLFKILFIDHEFKISFIRNYRFIHRIRSQQKKNTVIACCLVEHLGDIVAAEPITREVKLLHPNKKITWFTKAKYVELFTNNQYVDEVCTITSLTEWIFLRPFMVKNSLYDLNLHGTVCPTYFFRLNKAEPKNINTDNYYKNGNLLHAFSRSAGIEMSSTSAPIFHIPLLKNYTRPDKFIVLHTTSHSKRRMWSANGWSQLTQYITEHHPQIKILEIGESKQVNSLSQNYINFTGIRPLQEIGTLINQCAFYIGIDSSFAHIANALQKDSLIFLGEIPKFKQYFPYSGFFYEERKNICIHYPDLLNNMPFSYIKNRLKAKLNNIQETNI